MSYENHARQLQPVFITAPTARNGITLLQRLFNSTRQIIVFGENKTAFDTLPALAINFVMFLRKHGERNGELLERVRSGDTEFWSSEINPPAQQLVLHAVESFYSLVSIYESSARELGFSRWGLKNPMPSPKTLHRMCEVLPQAKIIMIYRDPYDVAASAKARQFVRTPAEFTKLGQEWRINLSEVLNNPLRQLHMLRYESLMEDPLEHLKQLEMFADVRGMDPAVLERKINTFIGPTAVGYSPTQYVEPSPLTDEETRALEAGLGTIAEQCGYARTGAAVSV